jgi:hypothetical protein
MNIAELKMKLSFNSLYRPLPKLNNPTIGVATVTAIVGAMVAGVTTNVTITITITIISIDDDLYFPLTS